MSRANLVVGGIVVAIIAFVGFVLTRGGDDESAASTTEPTVASDTVDTDAPDGASSTTEPSGDAATTTTDPLVVTADPDPTDAFEASPCAFDEPAGVTVECGYVTVPEDRREPDGRQIRLHVARFPTAAANPATPVVYLEGGPGGEPLETVNLVFGDRYAEFVETRDLIVFDQRGTGFSEPSLACDEYREFGFDLLEQQVSPEEASALERDVLADCRQGYLDAGIDIAHYNSLENAADVDAVRRALGIDEWNLYGISYGTRLALTVMRDHPTGVRSAILDSAYPPEVDGVADFPENARRAFDVLFDACAADAACAGAYGDIESRLYALVDRLDATPTSAPVIDFFTGRQYDAVVSGTDLLGVLFQGLYSEQIIPSLPELIDSVDRGETSDLGNVLSLFIANGEFLSIGMYLSVQCNEEVPFADIEAAAAAAEADPFVGNLAATSVTQSSGAIEFCQSWASGTADPIENLPVDSDIPTLVMAGSYDPITPPEDGAAVAARLPNAVFVEFPTLGHGVSAAGECPLGITLAFLDDPMLPPDTSCVPLMAPPRFAGEAPAVDIVLEAFEAPLAGVKGVAPAHWTEVGVGTFARSDGALDQTALLQLGAAGIAPDFFADTIGAQLNLDEPLAQTEVVDVGGRQWSRYEGRLQGYNADVYVTEDDGTTLVVVLLAQDEDRQRLIDDVVRPALEAIEPV